MDITIRRLMDISDDGALFNQFLKTLSSDSMVAASSIDKLEEAGAYKTHITIPSVESGSFLEKIARLIEKRAVLDGDIVILNKGERLIVVRGELIPAI
ncbi:hypothetical protein ACTG16_23795 [Aeromonas sp. 23P]|uniref:hypothetical protein n=1 Tax=Aeromonas sp. 23P TaxID=3452716 RepID=UPI003F7AFB90|nr:hypothetical protein [Aeromonas veronii]